MIAACSLMFKSNTTFQLAMALLVMFFSYVLQMQYSPYMSMEDRAAVVKKEHKERKTVIKDRLKSVATTITSRDIKKQMKLRKQTAAARQNGNFDIAGGLSG